MKIFKYFFNILFVLNIFVIISCASTPKTELPEEKVLDELNESIEIENTTDAPSEDETSKLSENQNADVEFLESNATPEENIQQIQAEQSNDLSLNETTSNEYSYLEEKIEEDILPELPPLEEIIETAHPALDVSIYENTQCIEFTLGEYTYLEFDFDENDNLILTY